MASVKIPLGKQCGFVQFVSRYAPEACTCIASYFMYNLLEVIFKPCNYVFRTDAEEALQGLNGSAIGKQAVRLSWGRSLSHKQVCHV